MGYYHASGQRGPFFEGWYFKHQGKNDVLALIPAVHIDKQGKRSASLQVVTEGHSWWLEYPDRDFDAREDWLQIRLGNSMLSADGIRLDVERDGVSLHGEVGYGPFAPLRSDIMGPFRFLPGMECRHGVLSMGHALDGSLTLNGQRMDFSDGMGYVETDRGSSFPSAYLWTQCIWPAGSLMLSVATIPLPVGGFTGCICAIRFEGQEYRLATYLGAKILSWSGAGAVIRQGKDRLKVECLEVHGQPLRAPVQGGMERVIRESLRADLRFRFWRGGKLLFDHQDRLGSFEYSP